MCDVLNKETNINHQNLPAIFFSFDEQSGSEGFRTRLEAFIDLMYGRREKLVNNKDLLKIKRQNFQDREAYGNLFFKECYNLIGQK